jgi:hypothetical protein
MEREVIKKVLRESEWDWTGEDNTEAPIDEVESWIIENQTNVREWIKKIKDFYEKVPQMDWNNNDDYNDQNKMIALSVKGIGDELRNILASFETIKGEMDYIRNPEKYDQD